MANYRMRAAAKADLKGIGKYTEQTWDRDQRNTYLADFDRAFRLLAEDPERGKAAAWIRTDYRALPTRSHFIYYKVAADGVVDIIRILHKRMDVAGRLRG